MRTSDKYSTVDHLHFDCHYSLPDGKTEYPDSALMLVECADGRWYIEQEFGTEYSGFDGVVKSAADLETVPQFYPDAATAAKAAFEIVKQVYPTARDDRLQQILEG